MGIFLGKDFDGAELMQPAFDGGFLSIGVSWEAINRSDRSQYGLRDVDLDASCLLFDSRNDLVDFTWFRSQLSDCGGVKHEDTGLFSSEGQYRALDSFQVNFERLAKNVTSLVFVLNSFDIDTFENISSCSCQIHGCPSLDGRREYRATGPHKAFAMLALRRLDAAWKVEEVARAMPGLTMESVFKHAIFH